MTKFLKARISQLKSTCSDLPVLGILVRAGLRAAKQHEKDMAASIAFFSFLSIFPLALGLVAISRGINAAMNLKRTHAVYGSITSIIVLMLWLYYFGRVILYGAEVNAVLNHMDEKG
jgi:uncharacterized BrkB/YihY/UPF0761 family membrane protein